MKKLLAAVLIIISLSVLFAFSANGEDGVTYTLAEDGKSYMLSSYSKNEAEVKIPREYKGLPVGKIASGAFSGNISTYKIIIPDSVQTVEDGAFSAMPSLYEFEASGNYVSVDGVLFTSDKKTLVRYPEARTGEYKIPQNVKVGAYAFSGSRLTEVDAAGMTAAGRYAFYLSDIKNITLSSSLTSIGAHAFEKSAIEKITVPGAASVSEYAFACCEKLVYADISASSLDGVGIFYSDTSLIAVSFPQNQTAIPELTFAGCTALRTAPIGKNVKTIASKAFYGCVDLEHASCGGASYGSDTFSLCDKLTPDNGTFTALKQKNAEITLKVGETYTPADTGYDLYTVSSNVRVENGAVTAVFEGEADVYAVSRRGGDCAVLKITVSDGAAVIESAHPYEKGTFRYTYTVPGNPERIAVTFSSSDMLSSADAVKIQDKNGNLYGTYYGGSLAGKTLFIDGDTVEVTLVSITAGSYGFRVSAACPVAALPAVRKITLPQTLTLQVGGSLKLSPAITPADAFPAELLYITDNANTAGVTSSGTVYGVSEGETDITVYSTYYGVYAKCTATVTASQGENEFEYEIINNGAYITGYNGAPGVCTVPDTLGGAEVRGIKELALAYSGITELYLPASLSEFAAPATDGNSSLTGIYVPAQSQSFKTFDGALYSKNGKTLYRVPCGIKGTFNVPDSVEVIVDGAFSCCFGIEKLYLGSSVRELSGKAFLNCANLKSIVSDSDDFTVVDGVLYSSDKKTLVYFPAGLNVNTYSVISGTEIIGAQAFNSAVNLNRIVLPATVSDIDGTALCEAGHLTEISVNSSNVFYTVSNGALYENGKLKFVPKNAAGAFAVNDNTTKILPYAFYNCAYITDITIPNTVNEIGEYSFGYCASLDRLYLPKSTKTVGYDAFCGDKNMQVCMPGGASLVYLSDCTVLCGKNTDVCAFCEANGISYEYAYLSEYGLYTVCSPVNAQLRVEEEKDPVLLAKYKTAAGRNVKAFSVYLQSDGVKLPAGEYALYRSSTNSKRYYYEDGQLVEIKPDAVSVYRRYAEHIIELSGDELRPALAVRTLPNKLEYKVYDSFDGKGMSLYYTDEHGLTKVVDKGFDVKYDFKSAGEKTVTVTYKNASVSFAVTVKGASLSGVVKITGSGKYGGTLTADVSGVEPADAELSYQWYADGKIISGADKNTYKPDAADIGKKITVKISSPSAIEGELESGAVTVAKASAPVPPKPVIASADQTSVVLQKVDGCEYRLSTSGSFTDSNVFRDLKPGETYIFCQRYKETKTTEASEISSTSYQMQDDYKLKSDKYFINPSSGAVSLIDPGTSVKTLREGFKYSEYIGVFKEGKQLSDTDTAGTGCEIRLTVNGKVYEKSVCVITGDVNGDGKITITDYLKIKERIQSGTTLAKEKEYASDVNGDGKVTITDYLRLKYCIQNNVKPEQNRY